MGTLVRDVRPDENETVMVLGGVLGAVTLHISLCGKPEWVLVHSPRRLPGMYLSALPCSYLEMGCWCIGSIKGSDLSTVMESMGATADYEDERTWALMSDVYRIYLEEAQR